MWSSSKKGGKGGGVWSRSLPLAALPGVWGLGLRRKSWEMGGGYDTILVTISSGQWKRSSSGLDGLYCTSVRNTESCKLCLCELGVQMPRFTSLLLAPALTKVNNLASRASSPLYLGLRRIPATELQPSRPAISFVTQQSFSHPINTSSCVWGSHGPLRWDARDSSPNRRRRQVPIKMRVPWEG